MAFSVAKWKRWIADRFALRPFTEGVLHRKIPKAPWYYGDGATLLTLFGVLVVTGAAMALTYSPSPDSAYQSVRHITYVAPLGWLVRGLHYWSAGLMVVMVLFHLFRVIAVGGYKSPREGTWLVGVFLFFAVFIMGFTGYLLRWDERAIYATSLVLHMFNKAPLIGEWIVLFVQGGEELGARTLTRMYAVHILFVPALMGLLVALHLYLIIKKGTTTPSEREQPVESAAEQQALYEKDVEERGEYFYPETMARSGLMALAVFSIAAGLTLFAGNLPMYPEANLVEPSMPQEEWWYWWYSGLIATIPNVAAPWMLVLFPPLLFLTLVLLPFVDRNPHRKLRRRPLIAIALSSSLVVLLWMSVQRVRSPWTGWPTDELPPVPEGVLLTAEAEQGRVLFSRYGCSSCHAVAGRGPQVGPEMTTVGESHTREQLITGILAPPRTSSMPLNYGERMSPEEIGLVVAFIQQLSGGSARPPSAQRETTGGR